MHWRQVRHSIGQVVPVISIWAGRDGQTLWEGQVRISVIAATVTWGIVPDGTLNRDGDASNLVAFLNGIYGDNGSTTIAGHSWFPLVSAAYQEWSQLAGLNLEYEPNDDGVQQSGSTSFSWRFGREARYPNLWGCY